MINVLSTYSINALSTNKHGIDIIPAGEEKDGMRNESIEGIGSVRGGEYGVISVEGVGKLKGKITAEKIKAEGMIKGKKPLKTGELSVEGAGRFFGNIRSERVKVEGLLKLRRASLCAKSINCEGLMVCTREINADNISIDGLCSAKKLCGDIIDIKTNQEKITRIKGVKLFKRLALLYFGRHISVNMTLCDTVECTSLTAKRLRAGTVRANSVHLSENCKIKRLYCDGELFFDATCEIGEIITGDKKIKNTKGGTQRANLMLTKILDMYKEGKINPDEAEKMLASAGLAGSSAPAFDGDKIDWPDDGKLRIVAFIGRKLLKKGAPEAKCLEVTYEGEALDVISHFSITCKDIKGTAAAGSCINCGDIGGGVSAGSSVQCANVNGNISAGSGVHAVDVKGNISAGSGVTIKK